MIGPGEREGKRTLRTTLPTLDPPLTSSVPLLIGLSSETNCKAEFVLTHPLPPSLISHAEDNMEGEHGTEREIERTLDNVPEIGIRERYWILQLGDARRITPPIPEWSQLSGKVPR